MSGTHVSTGRAALGFANAVKRAFERLASQYGLALVSRFSDPCSVWRLIRSL